jgi:uncharacterized protein with NRDE domain
MCLVAFATETADHHLIVAANRDELHRRPASAAAWWADAPDVFGGRDLDRGGTWLAFSRAGRFAAVTNVRRGGPQVGERSRGELCASFVRGDADARSFADTVTAEGAHYGPFSLLVASDLGRGGTLAYASSENPGGASPLAPGVHALSNAAVDTPWPKVVRATAAMSEALGLPIDTARAHLFAMLGDRRTAGDDVLPSTGVGRDLEKLLSAVFLVGDTYGTRCSTLLEYRRDGEVRLEERTFAPDGALLGTVVETFRVT